MFFIPLPDCLRGLQVGKGGADDGFQSLLVVTTIYLFTIEDIRGIYLALLLC